MIYQVLLSQKHNEKVFMNVICCSRVVCCSRDWHFKGLVTQLDVNLYSLCVGILYYLLSLSSSLIMYDFNI